MTEQPMLTIQLTESDYLDAQALHMKSSRRRAMLFWSVILGFALAGIWVLIYGRGSLSNPQLAGVLGGTIGGVVGGILTTLAVRHLYLPRGYRRVFRQQKSLQLPFHLSWSDDGFVSENEQGSLKTRWSDIVNWKENEQLFVLYVSDLMFHILPKRAFPDEHTISAFRGRLARTTAV